MEIKATLNKPYTDIEKLDFIVENNHKLGYEIKETQTALEAWGYSNKEELKNAKELKYNEACLKAYEYLNSGEGLFEFQKGKHIEATGDNIAKLTTYAIELSLKEVTNGGSDKILVNIINLLEGIIAGLTVKWTTKEDEIVNLNILDIRNILKGLGDIQTKIWGTKFPNYKKAIENAKSVQEVEAIVINYDI